MKKLRKILCIAFFAMFIFAISASFIFNEPISVLASERRKAAQFPEFSAEKVIDKSFFDGIEDYLTDQFPLRDKFREIKAAVQLKIFNQKDNNGTYFVDGHISEMEETLSKSSVENAAKKINAIYEKYLRNKNNRVFYSVIPDKNYFLAEKNGYPSYDYHKMTEILNNNIENMEYIDIFDCLTIDDYYKTDSHWKQENLSAVVEKLGEKMGFDAIDINAYTPENLGDFNGVYASRLALGFEPDKLICMRNEATNSAVVYNVETQKEHTGVYDTEKMKKNDKYDVFFSGAVPIITAENPLNPDGKELVIFRDSFGSSLAPLLLGSYGKITLVDTRYISSQIIGNFVDFENCDVLFIYNTQLLNQSSMLK
ncbi:MAG: hypothetical protein IKK63_05115 [Clostridia bacterium]|nr:hypothetical protein [Clostridia bacterium]